MPQRTTLKDGRTILSQIICHTLYMSQSICHNCFGMGVKDNCEGERWNSSGYGTKDMSQKTCHKQHIYGPCCKHKETLPRKGDGSPEGGRCMRLQQSHIKCHTMYMSQCICHNVYVTMYMSQCICHGYLRKVVMIRRGGDRMIGICHNADVTMYMSHTVYVTKYMSQLLRKGGEGQL